MIGQTKNEKPSVFQPKILKSWALKRAQHFLKQMELEKVAETLSLHWNHIRQGFVAGYTAGVVAGFDLGMKTADKLAKAQLEIAGKAKEAGLDVVPSDESGKQLELPL